MTEPHPSLEEILFDLAVQKATAAERAAFLDHACRDNPALRVALDELLEFHFGATGFLPQAVARESPPVPGAIPGRSEAPAEMLGRYKLLEKIGEGGFGEVWMAEQREPVKRRVALKIIKLGMDSRQIVARFEAERQALAMMDHANIARIYDADMTETGRPYFVMELVRGIKITDYCDQNQLTTRDRLDLFTKVCQAIQHAHQKGIIHRDIKPSNILVTLHDGVPVPKVIDFGIAKATQQELTDKTVFTQFQQFIGTPAYISPEQAEMSGLDIDTRADIYSLGVLLYELLIGQTPFDPQEMMKGGLDALRRIIREKEPLRPSTKLNTLQGDARTTTGKRRQTDVGKLAHQLKGDLDWIVMKCLEKDRTRRYDTANGLAMDIQRHLANEPITARPPSTAYKIQKAWQRNKLAYTSAVLVAMALVVGATVSLWQAWRATRAQAAESHQRSVAQEKQKEAETAQRRAEASEKRTSDLLYSAKLNLAQVAFEQSNFRRVHELLEETRDHPKRGFEWYYWQRQIHGESRILRGIIGEVYRVAFSPDGTRVAAHGLTQLIVWDAASGRELLNVPAPHKNYASRDDYSTRLRFSPDGKQLLMLGETGLEVRDAFSGTKLFTLKGVNGGDYSPDGSLIATVIYRVPEPGIVLWDARTGKRARTFRREASEREALRSARFTGDGKALLLTTCLGVSLLDATTGEPIQVIVEKPVWDYPTFYLSHDGKRLLESDRFGLEGNVWDATKTRGKPKAFPGIHECESAEFSPDDRWVVATRPDQTANLIDLDTGEVIRSLKGHWGELLDVAWSRDGRWVATASADGSVRLWDLETRQNPHLCFNAKEWGVILSPDERAVVSTPRDGATLRELATGRILRRFLVHPSNDTPGVFTAAFSPDGTRIATGSSQKTVNVFDVATGSQIFSLSTSLTGDLGALSYSPDGTKILTSGQGGAKTWEAETGRFLLQIPMNDSEFSRAIFSPDGRQVATTSFETGTQIWDAETGNLLRTLEPGGRGGQAKNEIETLAYSPDGRHLALGQIEGLVTIWEVTTGEKAVTMSGHRRRITSIGYSKDGRRLLTASGDKTARLWDVEIGSELLALKLPGGYGNSARFFADGRRILISSWDSKNYPNLLWEAATPEADAAWEREHREAQENMKKRLVAAEADAKAAREALAQAAVSPEPIPRHRPPSSGSPTVPGDPGVIRLWLVMAPLPGQSDTDLAVLKQQIPNESQLRPRAGESPSTQSGGAAWTPVRLGENSHRLNFLDLVKIADPEADTDDQVAYAVAYIVSEYPQSGLSLLVGSDDTARAYLNGKEIYRQLEGRGWKADQDEVPGIKLKAGLNVLVFKVANGLGGWDGSVRFTTADGRPVPGLTVTLDPDAVK